MKWEYFAFISIVSISVANIFQRVAMKKQSSDPVISSIVFMFLVTFITGAFALLKGFEVPSAEIIPNIIISSMFYAFGTLFIFKAIKEIEASELTIVATFGSFATLFSAYIFLGERLSFIQLVGVFLIFTAVYFVNNIKSQLKLDKGLLYALIGNSMYGLAVTSDTFALKNYDAVSYTPMVFLIPGIILCLISFQKIKRWINNNEIHFDRNVGVYSFLYSIQVVAYYLALESGALASQISVIFKTEMILTVILATLYLKERKNLTGKFFAMIFSLIGTWLIIRSR